MTTDTHLLPSNSQPSSVEQMVEKIIACGKISRNDQHQFMAVLLSRNTISKTEQTLINRVFDLLRSGRLRVVD